jgi:hypothetical protein
MCTEPSDSLSNIAVLEGYFCRIGYRVKAIHHNVRILSARDPTSTPMILVGVNGAWRVYFGFCVRGAVMSLLRGDYE